MHTITFSNDKGTLTIFIERDIDHHNAADLRLEIDRAIELMPAREIRLDFDSVEFMDSSGLGLILGRYTKIRDLQGSMKIEDPSKEIEKILTLAGVDRLIPIVKTGKVGN